MQSNLVILPQKSEPGTWDILRSWGIEIVEMRDNLFYEVCLPEKWELRKTTHEGKFTLYDNKQRKRIEVYSNLCGEAPESDAYIYPILPRYQARIVKKRYQNFLESEVIDSGRDRESEDYVVWRSKMGSIVLYTPKTRKSELALKYGKTLYYGFGSGNQLLKQQSLSSRGLESQLSTIDLIDGTMPRERAERLGLLKYPFFEVLAAVETILLREAELFTDAIKEVEWDVDYPGHFVGKFDI